jgi:uncharacterized protein (DUF2147 family)
LSRRRLSAALLLAAGATALPASAATPIAGRYLTEDGAGIVQVGPCGAAVCGRLVRILKARPGAPTTDVNNRDPALRSRPIQGIAILSGFTDRGGDWRGTIYDPRNGKSYRSIVSRNPDGSLKVQGCIAVFCQTQRWSPAG